MRANLIAAVLLMVSLPALAEPVCRTKTHRICRSHKVVAEFKKLHPCPSTGSIKTCATHVVDHKESLACAKNEAERKHLDALWNLQWQMVAEAKEKDKWERKACGEAD